MSGDLLARDERARLRALDVESFIVEAPAGAGKTELLTQRYLRLLATVKEPEEIIAITFTNKAAAEMRARILGSLAAATDPAADDPAPHKQITRKLALSALARDAECEWNLIGNPARLRITTIDALSASLARQMPFLSRFGAQPAVTNRAAEHYAEAVLRTLALLEEDSEAGQTVAAALRYFHNDMARLRALLESMLERRDQWLIHLDGADQHQAGAVALLVEIDLARAAGVVNPALQAQLMPVARYAAGNLLAAGSDSAIGALAEWTEVLAGELGELDAWRSVATLLLTTKGALRSPKGFNKNMGLPPEGKPHKEALAACIERIGEMPGAEAALARIQLLPAPVLDADEARIVAVFASLLKLAAAQLWKVFQQQREVDFIEIAQRALAALGSDEDPSSLQLRLDYRISHLLVDEFQDTSPAQIMLLERLTAGWQAGDGRTLFVVGDPMQSIYRFRKADVGLFLQARDVGIGPIRLEALRLNRNNRSYPEVVEWINDTFPTVFPAADNPQSGAVRYVPSIATKPSLASAAGVIVHPILVAQDSESVALAEAQSIIAILRAERTAQPQASVAILVRARSHLDALVGELQRGAPELRYQAVEIERLEERQVIQDLLALTRALHHRADRVNWLAVLRAPWCGLTLADLHVLAADDHRSTVWQLINDAERVVRLSPDGRQRLAHLRAACAEALAQQGRVRTRRWIEATWRMLDGEACLRSAAERADADAYFRLIDRIESGGGFSLDRLDKEISSLYAEPDPHASDGNLPAIQIMTVHKSKGLEFDVVILPGLHRTLNNNGRSLLLWEEFVDGQGREQLVIAPVKPRRGRDDTTPSAYDYLRTLDLERESNEGNRVLYVAATRAIRALHLVAAATVETGEQGDAVKPPKKGSPLAALWPVVGADFNAALNARQVNDGPELREETSLAQFIPRLTRLVAPRMPEYLQQQSELLAVIGRTSVPAETEETGADDAGRSLLADIGTLVHRILEIVARDGPGQWTPEGVGVMSPMLKRWLRARGHAEAVADAGAAQAREAVRVAIASEAGRWLLKPRASAGIELALACHCDGHIQANVIDRTFVENGERWIIDYKTTRFDSASDADFSAQAETHRPQLERYAALFAEDGLPVRMAIFYVAHGRLVELSR